MRRIVHFYILFLFIVPSVFGQFYEVTRYADDNGLPSRIVRDVSQDSNGYLWVAGNNGLYKFDGQQFHAFYSTLNDTTGLRDNKINTVLAAKDGKIWIATPKGLHVLVDDTIQYFELFGNVPDGANHILDLFEDSNQNIWISSYGGFFVIEKVTGKVRNLSNQIPGFPEYRVIWGITEDYKGRIWVCRGGKPPLVAAKGTFNFKEIQLQIKDATIVTDINPFKYIQYNDDIMLINAGIGLLKGELEGDNTLSVSRFYDKNGNKIGGEFIYNSIIDSDRNIWTATWKNRFKKYRIEGDRLVEQQLISKNGLLDMSGHARSVYQDTQKNIWIANSNGLYKLSKSESEISIFPPGHVEGCLDELYSIYGLAEDRGGHLWINTPTNLYRFNKEDILVNNCPTDYLKFTNEHFVRARDLFVDSENRLWVSGQEGLSIAQLDDNYRPGKFVHITMELEMPHKWSNGIVQEDKNSFWVGNYIRLVHIVFPQGDLKTPRITTYDSSDKRPDALVNSYTLQLEQDKDGALWVGTFSGLSKLISAKGEGTFKNYESGFGQVDKLSNNAIKDLFKDSKGRLWIGTQTGLNLYNKDTDNFLQFGRKEGLPSEYILGISEDSKGHLWVATTQGLFKAIYNESMQGFVHIEYFTDRDGLADNITNRNALYIDADDNVYIGSSKGLSIFGNSETTIEARKFNLDLTTLESIQKKDQGFVSIKGRIVDNEIELSNKENSIHLGYAVLDFTDPGYNQYRHKFLPVSEEWIETGGDSHLNYYNLAPGNYELILDGSNNQGLWSETPIHLKVQVMPPFWKSKWALVIYAILLAGILRLFYVMRVRKRMRELEQEVRLEKALIREREQLRNENAADFHDELGSKVTKISMFLTLAERTIEEDKDPSNWFGKIRENVKDLSGSFRDLLWVIDPKKDSLSDAVLRLKDFGEDLFSTTDTRYSTTGYSEELTHTLLDAQTKKQVVLIFKEAMHNCAKYSESTMVELTIETSKGYSSIRLKDNGKGFNVHRQSKGRGLTNMKNRSEKIGGNLSIVSSKEGTVVSLHQIPHLREDNNDKEL